MDQPTIFAGVHVEDGRKVEPPFAGGNVGQIGETDLVGIHRPEVTGELVGRDRIAVTAVRGPRPARRTEGIGVRSPTLPPKPT